MTSAEGLIPAVLLLAVLLGAVAGPVGWSLAGRPVRGRAVGRYAFPMLAVPVLTLHVIAVLPPGWVLPGVLLAAVLVAITVADWEAMLVPDALSLPLIAAGLLLAWAGLGTVTLGPMGPWTALALHAAAAAVGYLLIHALALLWRRMRGVEGIGLGDAKLLAAAGAWLGPFGLPGVLLYASVTALVLVLAVGMLRRRLPAGDEAIPFGPFLAAGFWLVFVHGPPGL